MNKDEIRQLKNDLMGMKFTDEENKIRVFELLTKMEEVGLDDYEKEELVQIMEDEVDIGEKLKEISDELSKDFS